LTAEAAGGVAQHALCYLDLDRFKVVNDTCGHEAGDDLLRRIGGVFYGQLGGRDTLARLGGDEFGILLEYCPLTKAEEIAGKLKRAIEDFRYVWKERTFSLGVSVGLIPITAASGRPADILRAADAACYAAKNAGATAFISRGRRRPLKSSSRSRAGGSCASAARWTRATFSYTLQATVPLAPERPARPRCEILLRLSDERGGVETAGAFLPRAERHRLMPAIDRWVARETIAVLGRLHRDRPGLELPVCSINLSASSLDDADLIPAVREYLAQHRLPPEALCFEISEAAALGTLREWCASFPRPRRWVAGSGWTISATASPRSPTSRRCRSTT